MVVEICDAMGDCDLSRELASRIAGSGEVVIVEWGCEVVG